MTTQDLANLIAVYLLANWEALLGGSLALVAGVVTTTWLAARHWYQRDIRHLKAAKTASEQAANKEVGFLQLQLDQKDSYACSATELMGMRLAAAEDHTRHLLTRIQEQDKSYEALKKENARLLNTDPSRRRRQLLENLREEIEKAWQAMDSDEHDGNAWLTAKSEYQHLKQERRDQQLDAATVLPFFVYVIRAQTARVHQLNKGWSNCELDLSRNYENYCRSVVEILRPVTAPQKKSDDHKDYLNKVLEKWRPPSQIFICHHASTQLEASSHARDDRPNDDPNTTLQEAKPDDEGGT